MPRVPLTRETSTSEMQNGLQKQAVYRESSRYFIFEEYTNP